MKFEKLAIGYTCDEQRDLIFKKLDSMGYKFMNNGIGDNENCVGAYRDGDYQTFIGDGMGFDEFMSKYSNQFHEKIKQAMSDFGLNREELSMKLGYSAPYITKMLTLPQSEKVKKKVVEKIYKLYQSKKSIGTLVVDLEQSPEFKKAIAETRGEIKKVAEENEQLKKELDHKNQVLDKRNDLFKDAEYEIICLNDTIKNMQIVLNEKTAEIEGVKSAFEHVAKIDNERIAKLEQLNKQLGIDLSKRNKDVNLLNFGCVGLIVIVVAMACFVVGG